MRVLLLILLASPAGCSTDPSPSPAAMGEGEGEGEVEEAPARQRYADPLTRLGVFPGQGAELQDVFLGDGVAYVCSGNSGLHTFDLDDPATPVQRFPSVVSPDPEGLGGFARCQHVVADGRRVYASARRDQLSPQGLVLSANTQNLAAPAVRQLVQSELSYEGLDLAGDRLLVAAHGAGVRIFEAPEDGSLTEVGDAAVADAWGVRSSGDLVAVAAGRAGFELWDLSGAEPVRLGAGDTGGLVRDVEWVEAGSTLAIAAGPAGVQLWSVDDPAAPVELQRATPPGTALDVSVTDGLIAAATFNDVRAYRTEGLALAAVETIWTSDPISRPFAVSGRQGLLAVAEWGGLVLHAVHDVPLGPEVRIERSELDFGRVAVGDTVARALVVHNDGDEPLVLDQGVAWTTSPRGGRLFSVESLTASVPPGGAEALEVSFTATSDDLVRGVLRLFTDDADERSFEVELRANDTGLEVGAQAPALELADLDGQMRRLSDHAGDVVLLAWFGTYCPVCVPEMADLETAVWRRYKDEGLVMWGLNPGRGDTAGDVRTFAEQLQLSFPLMFDDVDYWRQFERSDDAISAFPIHVLVGRDGRIRLVRRRYERTVLTDAIDRALAEDG